MSFLYPYVLIGLALPVILAVLAVTLHHSAGKAWRQLVSPQHIHELVHAYPVWRTGLPALLALLALACTILAAARPINGYSESGAVVSGRNLIIALDVSRSMETRDVTPSRLDQAKAAAVELIQALPTDKIGLIVFSGDADMVVPLTYDHAALMETIDQVDRTWVEHGGTNLTLVLNRAMQDFKRSAPDGTNALVILSDGEETEDEALEDIAAKAKRSKLLVIAVGVGTTTGDTIPDPQGENGLWQDARGKHVISKLQPQTLRKLADLTGGDFAIMNSGTNLSEFARHAVNKLDRHEEQESISKTPNDLFSYFAITALILLVAAILLATDWRRPRRSTAMLVLLLLPFMAPEAIAEEASDIVEDDMEAAGKMSPAEHYAAGLQYLKDKKTDKAKTAFSRAMLSDDPALQAAAMHAMGNINTQATFDKLRKLYEPKETEGEDGETAMEDPNVTPEDLQGIADQLKKDLGMYNDALAANPALAEAKSNVGKIQGLIGKLEKEVKRMQEEQEQRETENQEKENENEQDADNKKEKDKKEGRQNRKDQKQKGGKNDKQQQQQQQNDQQDSQNNEDQQSSDNQQQQQQQQQGNKGKQDNQQNKQDSQNQQDQNQQDQQSEDQQDQEPREQQGDENQQESKSPQEKVDDLIDNLQNEIDRLKQQQKEKRTPKQQKEDAQDLIDNLKDELEKLKEDRQQDQGKDKKQEQDKSDKQDKDGQKGKSDNQDDSQQAQKELDEAMKLARELQNELQDLKDKAEKEQELSDEDRKDMQDAQDLIKNLQDEIRRLKLVQQAQQQQEEEEKDGSPALSEEKEKERAEQRAEGILRMSLDEEHGSPMPNSDSNSRTGNDGSRRRPRKDY